MILEVLDNLIKDTINNHSDTKSLSEEEKEKIFLEYKNKIFNNQSYSKNDENYSKGNKTS